LLLDLQVGSNSKFNVRKDGRLTLEGSILFEGDNLADIGAVGTNRPRNVYIAGTTNLGGSLLFSTDNAVDIGAVSDLRPRDVFIGRDLIVGGFGVGGGGGSVFASGNMECARYNFGLTSMFFDTTVSGTGAATVETTLHSVTVPAFSMGDTLVDGNPRSPTGGIHIIAIVATTGFANTKTIRLKFGGQTLLTHIEPAVSNTTFFIEAHVFNRASASSQIWVVRIMDNLQNVVSVDFNTSTVNTSLNQDVVITGETPNSADEVIANLLVVEAVHMDQG
jgi:hypothetical protein